MTNSKTGVDVTRWLVAAPDWLDPKWGGPNVEVVPAGAYDQLRAECERLTNKCAALVLVAYGTPENPKTPSVEPSEKPASPLPLDWASLAIHNKGPMHCGQCGQPLPGSEPEAPHADSARLDWLIRDYRTVDLYNALDAQISLAKDPVEVRLAIDAMIAKEAAHQNRTEKPT